MPFVSGDKLNSPNRVPIPIGTEVQRNGADLVRGTYLLTTDADCYVKQGGGNALTVAPNDYSVYLTVGGGIPLTVDGADSARFAVLGRSGTGTLMVQQVLAADPNVSA